jgi:glycosyltransferase involved in cell wall biosynthesis
MIPVADWYREVLIRNGVPSHKLRSVPQALISPSTSPSRVEIPVAPPLCLAFIGRVVPVKGLMVLLKALARLPPESYRLNIYGATDARSGYIDECRGLIQQRDLNATFCGIAEREEVTSILCKHHFLCMPSLFSEMSPLVIQEAFSAGTPVIGTDVAGISELVRHNYNGMLFPFGDYEALARMLQRLVTEPETLRIIRSNITPPRSFESVGESTLRLYEEYSGRK